MLLTKGDKLALLIVDLSLGDTNLRGINRGFSNKCREMKKVDS